jgi:NMD protein affecting ribosome stability and mRNA decay
VARSQLNITVCDDCGSEPAKTWTLTQPNGNRYYVDLCHRHTQQLVALCEVGTPARRGPFGTERERLKAQGKLT